MSEEIKKVRKQMEEDEQLATLMRGLRGQNLTDAQFADENITLRLVEVHFTLCLFYALYLPSRSFSSIEIAFMWII